MLITALRRFARLVLSIGLVTALGSLLIGVLVGASADRALTLGFYGVGCFFMVAGFFVGNRGPARTKPESLTSPVSPFAMFGGGRHLRWATRDEQEETIHNSAFFISLGFVLVVVGLLLDSRHSLF
jgi:hypothetical protein